MKILLLGGNGQVGHELRRSLSPLGELVVSTRDGVLEDGARCERLDLADFDALYEALRRVAPHVVVNAAAYTAVDRAEREAGAAFRINAEAPAQLADACASLGTLLVHYSTDYVFDGQADRPYREYDATNPLNVYGASKRKGEVAILESGCRHLIFRTGWVYGNHGANFMRTMLRLATERDELQVVCDQIGAPTPAALIAGVSARAIAASQVGSGLFHLAAGGHTSWHGFALATLEHAHRLGVLARMPRVLPIKTADYPALARRPLYSCLDTELLRTTFDVGLPEWEQGLHDVIASLRASVA